MGNNRSKNPNSNTTNDESSSRSATSTAAGKKQSSETTNDNMKSQDAVASTTTSTTTSISNEKEVSSLEEQINRALVAVQSSYEQTLKLHSAWRSQLQRVSLIVIFVIASQVKQPGTACVVSIKQWNVNHKVDVAAHIGLIQSMIYCAQDSIMEAMSLFCALCILWMIRLPISDQKGDFSSLPFRLSCTLLPLIILSYTQNRTMGCIRHLENNPYDETSIDDTPKEQRRPFPVVLIYFVIANLSLWAMQLQRNQGKNNIEKIEKLKQDLVTTKKKK